MTLAASAALAVPHADVAAHSPPTARALGAAVLGLSVAALLLARPGARTRAPARMPAGARTLRPREVAIDCPPRLASRDADAPGPEARRLYTAAAMLAASVLSDSAMEHYRGQFENPGMFAPLASAGLVLATALAARRRRPARAPVEARHGTAPDRAAAPDATRPARGANPGRGRTRTEAHPGARASLAYGSACAIGVAGLGFHTYNLLRRPGGLSWGNLFYAAPVGAPAALSLAGLFGLAAQRVDAGATSLLGRPGGQALCALSAFGLAGNTAEVALLHFRGAFQHPAMWVPVCVPPVGAALLASAAVRAPRPAGRLARAVLAACTWLGVIGMGFHARGVARQMGGWSNWSQNLFSGPPLPAPPSFSALALAGQAALALRARDALLEREAA